METAMDLFYRQCAEHSLKVTPQRVFIYQELLKASDHPSIDDIFKRVRNNLPNISFDTVYRTAISLAEIGIIDIVESGGSKRFDADISLHHHFHCLQCQKIIDFNSEYYDHVKIPEALQSRFKVMHQRIVLEGICDECIKKQ
jgi:Fur family peroxide stress response transcriptional regulator